MVHFVHEGIGLGSRIDHESINERKAPLMDGQGRQWRW
jgi:hypothetical protein